MPEHRGYAATLQHIELISAKRAKLESAQIDAEAQVIHAVAREFRGGNLGWRELERIYLALQPTGLPGWYSKRWRPAGLPTLAGIRNAILVAETPPPPPAWSGNTPFQLGELIPARGQCVVYILFDQAQQPCYVGSTNAFKDRLVAHDRDGKRWERWQAYRCDDREHAYVVEETFLQQHKPYLNKASHARRRAATPVPSEKP
jgi:hypothetical protein